ncbi:MAG TPA: hypothetical protein VFQ27_04890 [Xanthobacteraceae bacterium]|nr:hypothetical protein [Xanthobacteraceae bacterium]
MHVMLFLGGLVCLMLGGTALGAGFLAFLNGSPPAYLTAGTVAFVGGLVLLGMGSIARRLGVLADMIETQPLPRSVAMPQEDPSLRQAALTVEPRLSPALEGGGAMPHEAPAPANTAPPVVADRPAAASAKGMPAPAAAVHDAPSATDLAVLSTATDARASEPLPGARPDPPLFSPSPAAAAPDGPLSAGPHPSPAVPVEAAPADPPPVFKSGVIEGMAYTLYANGEVDAELPRHGIMRFRSIAEWRAFVRAQS